MTTRCRKRTRLLGTLASACLLSLVTPLAARAGDPPLPPDSCPAAPAEDLYVVKSGDVDNDTDLDIYLENASVSQIIDLPYDIPFQVDSTSLLPSLLLQDNGSGGYTLVVAPDPQTLAGVTWQPARHALREGDFDGDGTTDLFVWALFTGERSVLLHDVQIGETPMLAQVVAGAALGSELSQQSGNTVCGVDLNLNGRDDLLVDSGATAQASYTSTAGLLTNLVPYPPCTVGGERDSDCDGVADRYDAFPYDPSESQDTDGDGVGNVADLDDDNDGIVDGSDPHPLDENNGDAVGATTASFDVSPLGKARYRVPIRAVPSVGGVAPEISLAYSGEAGNGLVGMGFYVDGLSQITRCQTTLDQDGYINAVNFDSSDRFCLNGERLIAVEGAYGANNTEYRTERESHARIISLGSSGNGPQQFVVEQRGGLIETYGGTSSSRREAQASANVVTWAVSSVRDREGNTATFSYHNDKAQGDFRIDRIDYTANAAAGLSASNSIRFSYESRTDVELSHADSTMTRLAHRMTSISGYLGANEIFEYQLAYAYEGVPTSDYDGVSGRSRLKSVTECVDDVGCLPPTVFQWDVVNDGNFLEESNDFFNEVSALTESQYVIGDVNGDGRNDLVWTYRLNDRLTRAVYLANVAGDGFTPTGATQAATEVHDADYFASDADAQKFLMMDVDGDGKDDLVWVAVEGAHLYRVIYRARADGLGFDEQGYELDHDASYIAMTDHRFEKADVNGDGRDDLVWVFRSGHKIGRGVYWGSVGTGGKPSLAKVSFAYDTDYFAGTFELQQFATGDVNGDGKSDLVWTFVLNAKLFRVLYLANTAGSGFMKISLGVDSTIFSSIDLYSDQEALLGDVNNDGKDDLVWTFNYNDQAGRVLYLATPLGTSFSPSGAPQLTSVDTENHVTPKSRMVDVDRDGRHDIVYNYVDSTNGDFGWIVFHPNATFDGFVQGEDGSFGIGGNQQDYAYQYADVTGDGAGDLVWTYRTSTLAQHRVLLPSQTSGDPEDPVYPDHLDVVTDGLGKVVDFDYSYLVGSGIYTPGTGSTYPVRESPGLGFVVKHLEVSDGIGGERAFDYAYAGARTHLRGRGYLGFEERRVTDLQSGFVTTERYRQDYPFIGVVESSVVRTGGGTPTPVAKTFHHWDQDPVPYMNGSTPISTVFPFERESVTISYEPNDGGSKSTVLRESVYSPTFGNLLQTIETIGIDFTGPIDATFDPDGDFTASEVTGRELTVTTVNDYLDSSTADTETNWRFAFLESTTTTTDLEDNSEPNRVVTHAFTPWSATSFLTQTETRFAGTNVELTRTFSRDSYGNVTQTVVTGDDIDGGSIAAQTTTAGSFAAGLYPAQTTNALGHPTSYVYDQRLGTVSKSTDPNGEVSETVRDGFGRVVLERAFDGTETRHRYRDCSVANPCPPRGAYLVITTVTHPARPGALGAPTTTRYFDLLEREIRTDTLAFDGGISRIDRVYDARGRMSSQTEPHFSGAGTIPQTTYLYDDLDRATSISLPTGGSVTKLYESDDVYAAYERTQETITSPLGANRIAITHRWFDARGNVVVTTDPAGQTTATSYDGHGNRVTTRINGNAATDVARVTDIAGNPVSIQDPDAGSLTLAHDALGRLRRQVHGPSGAQQAIEVTTYDVLDRVVTRTDSLGGSAVGTATWSYKTTAPGLDLVESVSQTNYLRSFQYDHHSRLASTMTTLTGLQAPQTFQYAYDAFSRPRVTTYPNGFESHTAYSARGYAASVGDGKKAFWRADAMDARGKVSQETLGNGLQSTRVFDPATGNLQTLQTGPSGSVQNLTYTYDSGRNLVRRQSSRGGQVVTETLGYDDASRLLSANTTGLPGGSRNIAYTYDGLGNLKTQTGVSNPDGYVYGQSGAGIHAVTSVTLGSVVTSYGYDVRGNMTTSGARTIGYTPFNQVTSIAEGTELATEFRYGPDRQRYYQSTDSDGRLTKTAYYEGGLYEIVEEDGEIRRKAYVGDIAVHVEVVVGGTVASTKRIYLHRDHLGSVDTVTDGAGSVVAHSAFAPYGARRADDWGDATPADAAALPDRTLATTTRGFTDHEHLDASQLVHMGGRVYDPVIGRFLSPDPVVVTPDLSQGYNRYSYVLGNPLTLKDPTGLAPIGLDEGSDDRRRIRLQNATPSSGAASTYQLGGSPRPNAADGEIGASQGGMGQTLLGLGAGTAVGGAVGVGTGAVLTGLTVACAPCGVAVGVGALAYGGYQLYKDYENDFAGMRSFGNSVAAVATFDATFQQSFGVAALGSSLVGGGYGARAMSSYLATRPLSQAAADQLIVNATREVARGGLSRVGQAVQSHATRKDPYFAAGTSNAENTRLGGNFLRFLMQNGDVNRTTHSAHGKVVNVRLPDGAGARFSRSGEFIGLLERYTPR